MITEKNELLQEFVLMQAKPHLNPEFDQKGQLDLSETLQPRSFNKIYDEPYETVNDSVRGIER